MKKPVTIFFLFFLFFLFICIRFSEATGVNVTIDSISLSRTANDSTSNFTLQIDYPDGNAINHTDLLINGSTLAILNFGFDVNFTEGSNIAGLSYPVRYLWGYANGKSYNYTTTAIKGNGALQSYDTTEYISSSLDDLLPLKEFTIMYWIRLTSRPSDVGIFPFDVIIWTCYGAANYMSLESTVGVDDKFSFRLRNATLPNNSSTSGYLKSDNEATTNTWYHIALVATGKQLYIYINGVNQSTYKSDYDLNGWLPNYYVTNLSETCRPNYNGTRFAWMIGARNNSLGTVGQLDEMKLFNVALDTLQIKEIAEKELTNDTATSFTSSIWNNCTLYQAYGILSNTTDYGASMSSSIYYTGDYPTCNWINNTITNIRLASEYNSNYTNENITLSFEWFNLSYLFPVTDWRINNISLAVLNLPMNNVNTSTGYLRDYSSYENNVVKIYNNAPWYNSTSGKCKVGGCFGFSKTHQQALEIADDSSISSDLTNGLTIMLWLNLNSSAYTSHPGGYIINKLVKNLSAASSMYMITHCNYPCSIFPAIFIDTIFCRLRTNSGDYNVVNDAGCYSSNDFPLNTWTHVACVFGNGNLTMYINGVKNATTFANYSPADYAGNYGNLSIGSGNGSDGQIAGVSGYLDEIKIFNRPLSAYQIRTIYEEENINSTTETYVSAETEINDIWSTAITNTDTNTDSATYYSNTLTVLSIPSGSPPPENNVQGLAVVREYTKEQCKIVVSPSEINFTRQKPSINFTIKNEENFEYIPQIVYDESIFALDYEYSSLFPNDILTVSANTSTLTNGTIISFILIKSDDCLDVTIPVNIINTEAKNIALCIDSFGCMLDDLKEIGLTKIWDIGGKDVYLLYIFIVITIIILALVIIYGTLNIVLELVIGLILSIIVSALLYILIFTNI